METYGALTWRVKIPSAEVRAKCLIVALFLFNSGENLLSA
jgi:hypothetical protein